MCVHVATHLWHYLPLLCCCWAEDALLPIIPSMLLQPLSPPLPLLAAARMWEGRSTCGRRDGTRHAARVSVPSTAREAWPMPKDMLANTLLPPPPPPPLGPAC